MIASVHVADVEARAVLALLRRPPRPSDVVGLRHGDVVLAAPLTESVLSRPQPRRMGLIAFWDGDDDLDRFLADDPWAARLTTGWHVRLEPLRASGAWPGLPSQVPTARAVDHDGPVAALTLGRLRLSQAVRFRRTSARAEAAVLATPGLVWATGLARPPLVSSFSLWESTRALSTYASGHSEPAHPNAIDEGNAKPFHKRQAFIRFRPYDVTGSLSGKNPLPERWGSTV